MAFVRFARRFVALASECGRTGEPMLRSMDYAFPGRGYGRIGDQFVMGEDMIVAPQVWKGGLSRTVEIPEGEWIADDGTRYIGPKSVEVATPLSRLPYFERSDAVDARFSRVSLRRAFRSI